jgi:hypothetical protein
MLFRHRFAVASCVCALFAGYVSAHGPGSIFHPVSPPHAEVAATCWDLSEAQRDRVHVLMVNGVDPANLCNFHGLSDHVRDLGFARTAYYQIWEVAAVKDDIRRIRATDPQARVVLAAFSAGCNAASSIAQTLNEEGVEIDLLFYIAGDMLRNTCAYQPENCRKIVNVRAWGVVFLAGGLINGADLDAAHNHNLGLVRHACVPGSGRLHRLLADELYDLARETPGEEAP